MACRRFSLIASRPKPAASSAMVPAGGRQPPRLREKARPRGRSAAAPLRMGAERTANAENNETRRGHRRTYGVTRPFLRVAGRRGACGSIGFERPTVSFSLRPAELIQGFFMQDPNLSQVSLRFFNAVPYGVQLFLERHLASMIQRGFKALDAKCRTSGKGISLLCSVAGRHGSILEFAGT